MDKECKTVKFRNEKDKYKKGKKNSVCGSRSVSTMGNNRPTPSLASQLR